MFLVHEEGKKWIVATNYQINVDEIQRISAREMLYVKLWKGFFHSISIKERENYERQRQHLPLHYRTYVTEFQE